MSLRYCIVGAVIALLAPWGLLLVRSLLGQVPLDFSALWLEVATNWTFYVYVATFCLVVLSSSGWELGRREDEQRAQSFTDPLTSLSNRRALTRWLEHELARSTRYQTPLALLMMDLDDLKEINDRFGHAAGDRALRALASSLRMCCRASDLLIRYGGDEFVVVAPETTAAEATELADRIGSVLTQSAVRLNLHSTVLSVSIGVAAIDRPQIDTVTPARLLLSADEALYRAKREHHAIKALEQTSARRPTSPSSQLSKHSSDHHP
jgi:diguanylate cyclase (GGDEF)-like protein